MNSFNVSATLNVFRLVWNPTLCLPHATVPTFNQLPIPLNKAFGKYQDVDIRAVVLDKDDCFAVPKSNSIHKPYEVRIIFLRSTFLSLFRTFRLAVSFFSNIFSVHIWGFVCKFLQ